MKQDSLDASRLRQFCIVTLQFINARAPLPLMEPTIEALKTTPKRHLPIGDLLEWTADLKAADIVALDAIAKASNAATLSEVRAKFWGKRIPQILQRGRIRNDAEYYFLKEVADGAGCELPMEQIAVARTLVDKYAVSAIELSKSETRK